MTSILALLAALLIVLIAMPAFIRYLKQKQFGQTIYELGPQAHLGKKGTPNMGGVVIASATIVAALAFSLCEGLAWRLLPLILVALGAMAVGFADDYIKNIRKNHEGLKPLQKVVGQVAVGLLFSLYCYFTVGSRILLPFTKTQWNLGIFYIPIMTALYVFMTNSANLQDGADGLLSSVTVVGGVAMGVIALLLERFHDSHFSGASALCLFALVGASAGFLRYNKHPARIMMGDTGSMFIGGVFVGAAMLLELQFWLIPICFTMIMSSVSVIMQRAYFKLTHGKRIFKMSPIHHHFELSGMSENQIVAMYSLVTLFLSLIAVLATLPLLH